MFQFLKQLGWVGTLLTGALATVWGVLTYQHKTRLEFQRPWVEKNIAFCVDAAKTVGALTASYSEDEWKKAVADFWQLYWGQLVLIEPPNVASAMIAFGKKLDASSFEQRRGLGLAAFAVSKECRIHIDSVMADGWKIEPLSDLKTK